MQFEFTANSKLKPSTLYRKKIMILKTDHFPLDIDQVQVDHLRVSKIYHQKTLYHAILLIPLCKKQFVNKKRKLYGYINFQSISHSKISVTLTDKGLLKFYYFVSQYDALFFDATGSFVSPLSWLRNEKDEMKRILFNALIARIPLVDLDLVQFFNM